MYSWENKAQDRYRWRESLKEGSWIIDGVHNRSRKKGESVTASGIAAVLQELPKEQIISQDAKCHRAKMKRCKRDHFSFWV